MTSTFRYTIETLDWRGTLIQVGYAADYTGNDVIAHIEVETQEPARAPLPITETGYRSHFLGRDVVEERGGPSAYVLAWLEEAAKSQRWAFIEAESRQLALF